ncbi:MAG: glycosyltransferase family 4 protein [Acidimicrobiia bacterium]|nr:glycosyltransferase family 4 protein [Acidimicrobiia bacterium]
MPSSVGQTLADAGIHVSTDMREGGIVLLRAGDPTLAQAHVPPNSALWWWVDSGDETAVSAIRSQPGEAVLVASEALRTFLEREYPAVVGDVWSLDGPRLNKVLNRYYPTSSNRYRLGVVGYNLKFAMPIVTNLVRNPGIEALIDEWPVFAAEPTPATDQVLEHSDVTWCEWCGPNAVYASRNKKPGQRLVVRLHRFELETPHWQSIDHEQVDAFVTVGDYYRRLVIERTGWPAEKVTVIANLVDDLQLQRRKRAEARFNLGLLGASSSRKRLDLALDIIEAARRAEPGFRLRVKTALPRDEKWVWDDPAEREYFAEVLERLHRLQESGAVVLDPFGRDVAEWFAGIGFILSLSDDESFHLAPAEGMATGAVPVVRNWPGADSVYSPTWVLEGVDAMVERILDVARDSEVWLERSIQARNEAVASFALDSIVSQWDELLGRGAAHALQ